MMKPFEEWMKQRRKAGNILACVSFIGLAAWPLELYFGIPTPITLMSEALLFIAIGVFQGRKLSKESKREKAAMENRWAQEDEKLFNQNAA